MKKGIFLVGLMVLVVVVKGWAQVTNAQVYSLFVMNIAKYSSWPSTSQEFQIVVFGDSKVYEHLQTYAQRGINGKTVKIIQASSVSEIGTPNIVYISSGSSGRLSLISQATDNNAVMLITEEPGYYKKGADFSFLTNSNNNLRFDIHATQLQKKGIKVAKNFLGMAHEVL